MKAFETLTESELVELSEDQIQRYIDYACADNGVALLPTLPPQPAAVSFTPDAQIFTVGYHWHFRTKEGALSVLEAMKAADRVETTYLSTPSGVTSHGISRSRPSDLDLKIEEAFSPDLAESIARDLAGAKREEDTYEKAKKAYDAAVSDRQCYADDIREKVDSAWATHRRREELRSAYQRYLSLANGQPEIASRFLSNAYRDAETLLPDLFPQIEEAMPA